MRHDVTKRGQITFFIIVGLVMVFTVAIALYVKDSDSENINTQGDLQFEPERLEGYLTSCLRQESAPLIKEMGKHGGTLNATPSQKALFHNKSFRFHCMYRPGRGCVNQLITRPTMEHTIAEALENRVPSCVNLSAFREAGYHTQSGKPRARVDIGINEIYLNLHYPVSLAKQDTFVQVDELSTTISSDLGYLYELAVRIRNHEIKDKRFNIAGFMRTHPDTRIERYRPYPHTLYTLKKEHNNSSSVFRFATQGYPTVDYIGKPSALPEEDHYGYCMTEDDTCHANTPPRECNTVLDPSTGTIGSYNRSRGTCHGIARVTANKSPTEKAKECSNGMEHGESSCLRETAEGTDTVGSRHYKVTCVDGKRMLYACRDYREEICVEHPEEDKAICRNNRWEDCVSQDTREECLNRSQRDCTWDHGSEDNTNVAGTCFPAVAPGIKFWLMPFNNVCSMGNAMRTCSGLSCPTSFNNRQDRLCRSIGDCGREVNVAGQKSAEGLHLLNPDDSLSPLSSHDTDETESLAFRPSQLAHNHTEEVYAEAPSLKEITSGISQHISSAEQQSCTNSSHCDASVKAAAVCSSWQAPYNNSCSQCSTTIDGFDIACTRYRCKSLGSACRYQKRAGYGHCINEAKNDTNGPLLALHNVSYPDDIHVEESSSIWDTTAHLICRGRGEDACQDDRAGADGLEAHKPLELVFNVSEDARCKTFPLNTFEFSDIPEIIPTRESRTFDRDITLQHRTLSDKQLHNRINTLLGYGTLLQITTLNDIDSLVYKMHNMQSFIGAYRNKGSPIYRFYNHYRKNISPTLHQLTEKYEYAMLKYFTDVGAKRVSTFIKCTDRANNPQREEFLIQYYIGKDRTPASMQLIQPPNTSTVKPPFNLSIMFNEPVQCRYDTIERPYKEMSQKLNCTTRVTRMRSHGYRCRGHVDTEFIPKKPEKPITLHIRCLDQPQIEEEYTLTLHNNDSSPVHTEGSHHRIDTSHNTAIVKDTSIFKSLTPILHTSDMLELNLRFREPHKCRYSTDSKKSFAEMHKSFECSNRPCTDTCTRNNCSTRIHGIDQMQNYSVRCIHPLREHRNEKSYMLEYEQW